MFFNSCIISNVHHHQRARIQNSAAWHNIRNVCIRGLFLDASWTVKGKLEFLGVSASRADRNRVRTLAGVQADLVALCKYLPLDGDGDHCTGWMDTVKAQRVLYSKESHCGTIQLSLFFVFFFVAFHAPLMTKRRLDDKKEWNEKNWVWCLELDDDN